MKLFKEIYFLLQKKDRTKIVYIFFLLLVSMFLEVLGIGMVIPFVTLLTAENLLNEYPFLENYFNYFNIVSEKEILIFGIIIFLLVFVFKTVFLIITQWIQQAFILRLVADHSKKLFAGYIYNPYDFHLNNNSANLLKNCTSLTNIFASAIGSCFLIFLEIFMLIGIAILLVYVEPLGATILIVFTSLCGYVFYILSRKRFSTWGRKSLFHEGLKIKSVQESFGGIKEIKLLGNEKMFIELFDNHNFGQANMARYRNFTLGLPKFLLELLAILSIFVLLFVMFFQGLQKEEFIIIIAVFGAAAVKLMPSTSRILFGFQNLKFCVPAIESYKEEKLKIIDAHDDNKEKLTSKFSFSHQIVFNNIQFKFEKNQIRKVVNGINLNINAGSTIGITGESGSGKTTLVDILLGLLEPDEGEILVDGVNIRENLRGWQKKLGYVPQNIYLSDDSLKNNIALGIVEEKIDEEAMLNAIKVAQLENLVNRLPKGINTNIGEMGIKLSGGERQRIGIARAIYKNPKILVLDEATSALDFETERKFMEAIYNLKGKKTLFIVSHRLSTIEKCDLIFQIKDGKIFKQGKYAEIYK